ncbi:MAG: TIGR00730 family Rossman fold protein [Bacteroidia bacterium]|nr:MAG: TIGR00730 family Rossman fold protein [Bacteroidia bacterium]
MKNICVFCGSSMGDSPVYVQAAKDLAQAIVNHGFNLVYGGADVGLMKVIADTVLGSRSKVIGIMPHLLIEKEVAHLHLDEMISVDSMAERKAKMLEISDAFVALPGGFGTIDEISEVLVMNQLDILNKPMALLNVNAYYDDFLAFCQHAQMTSFVRKEHVDRLIVSDNATELIQALQKPFPKSDIGKWIEDIKEESR